MGSPTLWYTYLFQLLVRISLPHILVFVVSSRIALPEKHRANMSSVTDSEVTMKVLSCR